MNCLAPICLAVLTLLTCACSFRSHLNLTVDVYQADDGELKPVPFQPDVHAWAAAAFKAESATYEAVDNAERAADELRELGTVYWQLIQAVGKLFAELSQKPEYQDKGAAYPGLWEGALRELHAEIEEGANATEKAQALKDNLSLVKSAFFLENGDPAVAILVEDVPVDEAFFGSLAKALSPQDASLQALVRKAYMGDSQAITSLAAALTREADIISKLAGTVGSATLGREELLIAENVFDEFREPYDDLVVWVDEQKSELAGGQMQTKLDAVATARKDLTNRMFALLDERDPDRRAEIQATVYAATLELHKRIDEVVTHLKPVLEGIDTKLSSLSRRLDDNLGADGNPFARLSAKASPETLKKAQEKLGIAPLGYEDTFAQLDKAKRQLSQASLGLGRARQVADNSVAAVKQQPFLMGDPNLKAILDPDNEEKWDSLDLDNLRSSGDGNTQFIVVMDHPTRFRPKRITADPKDVVALQVDIASTAFKAISQLALKQAGIDLDNDGTGTQVTVPVSNDSIDDQIDLVRESYEKPLTQLETQLTAILSGLPDESKDGDQAETAKLTELKAILAAYRNRLDMLENLAGKIQIGTGDNDPAPDPVETPPTDAEPI